MARDASLANQVKEALKQAAHDLDNLKLIRPDRDTQVAQLRDELRSAIQPPQEQNDASGPE